MWRTLFGKGSQRSDPVFTAELSPGRPFCVIGDIHGCLQQLDTLLDKLDAPALPDTLVCVGDYVDRGDHSAEVIDRLRARQARDPEHLICLMGNHERMLLDFLDAPEKAGPRWLKFGGVQTLISYRLPPPSKSAPPSQWQETAQELREQMGPETENWLRALPLSWQSGNVAVVHAAADPALSLADQSESTLLWGHPEFFKQARGDGLWIIHGHTILAEPEVAQGRIATDTGAFSSGRLTAAIVTPDGASFIAS